MGTMGIVTEMTIRLYPEPAFLHQLYPAYDEDHLDDVIDALYRLGRDNLAPGAGSSAEHLLRDLHRGRQQGSGAPGEGAMPRNNIMAFFGGSTKEEAVPGGTLP